MSNVPATYATFKKAIPLPLIYAKSQIAIRQSKLVNDLMFVTHIDKMCSKLYSFCLVFIMVPDFQEGPWKKALNCVC